MKQLGNLAVICAQRPELLMQLRDGLVLVQARNRAAMEAAWNDDARIERMIYEPVSYTHLTLPTTVCV